MNSVRTCYGQTIEVGSQVAYAIDDGYARFWEWINVPALRVARVVGIVQKGEGFAEADPEVELTLDDGKRIDCEKVVVTDGKFDYAT